MSESASWRLQKSLVVSMRTDAELVAQLGGGRVYDHVPRRASYPYVVVGQSICRDWSTSSEPGSEHLLTLHAWSKAGGKKQIFGIMNSVQRVLSGQLSIEDFRLVNLQHLSDDARLDRDGETYHGLMRYRAVMEPL